jgi:hypothetical protein
MMLSSLERISNPGKSWNIGEEGSLGDVALGGHEHEGKRQIA